jgi:hypothetical protein
MFVLRMCPEVTTKQWKSMKSMQPTKWAKPQPAKKHALRLTGGDRKIAEKYISGWKNGDAAPDYKSVINTKVKDSLFAGKTLQQIDESIFPKYKLPNGSFAYIYTTTLNSNFPWPPISGI